jgi:hypothetical protein
VRYFRRIFKRRVGLTSGQFRRLRPSAGHGTARRRSSLDRSSDAAWLEEDLGP